MSKNLNEYLNELEALGQAKTTLRLRTWQLQTWLKFLDGEPPSRSHIMQFLNNYTEPSTKRSIMSAIRSYHQWQVETGHSDQDPTRSIRVPKSKKAIPRPIPDPLFQRALEHSDDRVGDILIQARFAGLRALEIAHSRSTDLTRTGLRVMGKGGKLRIVPAHRFVKSIYSTADDWLHPTDQSYRPFPHLSAGYVDRLANRHLAIWAPGWTLHTLRHAFISEFYEVSGFDLLLTADVAGHANIETTRGYAKINSKRAASAVAKLAASSDCYQDSAATPNEEWPDAA